MPPRASAEKRKGDQVGVRYLLRRSSLPVRVSGVASPARSPRGCGAAPRQPSGSGLAPLDADPAWCRSPVVDRADICVLAADRGTADHPAPPRPPHPPVSARAPLRRRPAADSAPPPPTPPPLAPADGRCPATTPPPAALPWARVAHRNPGAVPVRLRRCAATGSDSLSPRGAAPGGSGELPPSPPTAPRTLPAVVKSAPLVLTATLRRRRCAGEGPRIVGRAVPPPTRATQSSGPSSTRPGRSGRRLVILAACAKYLNPSSASAPPEGFYAQPSGGSGWRRRLTCEPAARPPRRLRQRCARPQPLQEHRTAASRLRCGLEQVVGDQRAAGRRRWQNSADLGQAGATGG
jgi:hypothetical protein